MIEAAPALWFASQPVLAPHGSSAQEPAAAGHTLLLAPFGHGLDTVAHLPIPELKLGPIDDVPTMACRTGLGKGVVRGPGLADSPRSRETALYARRLYGEKDVDQAPATQVLQPSKLLSIMLGAFTSDVDYNFSDPCNQLVKTSCVATWITNSSKGIMTTEANRPSVLMSNGQTGIAVTRR